MNKETSLAGFASSDNATSIFFRAIDPGSTGSMQDLMDATITNFEQAFPVKKIDEDYKTGQVQGPGEKKWPAIFTTIEGELEAKPKSFKMRFYLMIFDTGESLYFIQASTTMPVRTVREREVLTLMKSMIAKPDLKK